MNTRRKKRLLTAAAALGICLSLQAGSFAAVCTGQGDGGGSFRFEEPETGNTAVQETAAAVGSGPAASGINSRPTTSADTGTGAKMETVNGVTTYLFDGKRYVVEQDWGTHYLTGFSPEATGSSRTASGNNARSDYTAASTRANLGKVILVQAVSGTEETSDIHRYDGVYKCEDTGGTAVEYGLSSTGGVPVVDLFFDTEEQADWVSKRGWITARIYILREVK